MERDTALYLDNIDTTPRRYRPRRAGRRAPRTHCSAAGKVLLANQNPGELDRRLGRATTLRKLTAGTITEPTMLTTELERIRHTGCAFDSGEAVPDLHCAAAPIKDEAGSVVAALSVTEASLHCNVPPSFKTRKTATLKPSAKPATETMK